MIAFRALLALVPSWLWVALGAAGLLTASIAYVDHRGYKRGSEAIQAKWDAEHVAMQKALDIEKARQAEVVTKTVTVYRDRVKVVKEAADVIEREIPVLVPAGGCELPGGFRVLHDAAAGAIPIPDDPARAAAAADPVEAVAAARAVTENYAACNANSEKLIALQELVKSLRKP